MLELWGVLVIFIVCPILGALPLISWITYGIKGRRLAEVGTKNISVSAAFYHGGTLVGILAVLSEAMKGIVAVSIAHTFYPNQGYWEIIALIALVIGRFVMTRGAGTTNVVWGFVVHDPLVAGFTFGLAAISFAIFRSRQVVKLGVLAIFPLFVIILHAEDHPRIIAAAALAGSLPGFIPKFPMIWIYRRKRQKYNLKECGNIYVVKKKLFL